ncbi:MAG TPA: anti-sigma factor [Rhodoferax sp.]|nr:anti-sigma factor [Rhodoferax sp.]
MTDTPATSPENTPPPCTATGWRIATIVCLIALAIAATTAMSMFQQFKAQMEHLQAKMKNLPQIKYVSVLVDDKNAPAQLITFDPLDNFVQIQRVNDIKEGPNDSMQLWAIPTAGKPRSLGVVAPQIKTAQLPATSKMLADITQLAISVENKGGVETGKEPRLPYLFKGALIQKAM